MKLPAVLAALACVGTAATVSAHTGATVAYAKFTLPADPAITRGDTVDVVAPYPMATADQSITLTWDDGGVDPTGRFFFYFLDHGPTFGVPVDSVESGGLATLIDDPVNKTTGYYISCSCGADMGVTCPNVVRDPATNCARRQITWNTSQLAAGTYWIAAINSDPPFHVYSIANGPVRIAHGTDPLPPAGIWVRPDGFGSFDQSYHLQWLAVGTAPLTFDLSYGDESGDAINAGTPLAQALKPSLGSDGLTYGYDWDTSALPNGNYYVRLKITDGNGVSSFTDSHFGVTIFHSGANNGGTPDMAMTTPPAPKKHSGCSAAPGRAADGAGLALVALLAAGVYLVRRFAR